MEIKETYIGPLECDFNIKRSLKALLFCWVELIITQFTVYQKQLIVAHNYFNPLGSKISFQIESSDCDDFLNCSDYFKGCSTVVGSVKNTFVF